jgi:hypothetical protein
LAILTKPKTNKILRVAVIFLFHLPQNYYLKRHTVFSKAYEGASFRDPNVRGAGVTSAIQVRASSPLLLLTVWNMKLWRWGVHACYQLCAKFWKNQSAVSEVKVMKHKDNICYQQSSLFL